MLRLNMFPISVGSKLIHEDGCNVLLRSGDTCLPKYTASFPRIPYLDKSSPWQPEI